MTTWIHSVFCKNTTAFTGPLMKMFLMASAFLALVACTSEPNQNNAKAMLQANDPKVCAANDVQRTALSLLSESYQSYLDTGGKPIEFKAVNSTGINADIHEIACSANVSFGPTTFLGANVPAATLPIIYTVRPSLSQDSDFVVTAQAEDPVKLRLSSIIQNYMSGKQGSQDTQPPPAASSSEQAFPPAAATSDRDSTSASIWKNNQSVSGNCRVSVAGEMVMDGPCSGLGHGTSVFVTAERDGCSIELSRSKGTVKGKVFAYKNTCGSPESAPNNSDVDLGVFATEGECLRSNSASVCLAPSE
jgi:hypothetical protein